jgi:hypothetical protein
MIHLAQYGAGHQKNSGADDGTNDEQDQIAEAKTLKQFGHGWGAGPPVREGYPQSFAGATCASGMSGCLA